MPVPHVPAPAAPSGDGAVPRAPAPVRGRFQVLFDEVDTPAVVLGLDARVVDANPACERVTGHRRADLTGRFVGVLMTRRDTEAYRNHWSGLVAGRRDRYELPGGLRCADGRVLAVRFVTALVRDGAGRPVHAVACAVASGAPHLPVPPSRPPTPGEALVLTRLAAGRTIQQIAEELGLTRRGVDYRLTQLRRKLRADGPDGTPATSAALVARAYRLGVLDPSTWPPGAGADGR